MVNSEETFGNLKFQALHRVRHNEDEEGNLTSEVRHISYDLRSDVQGMTVTVILPGRTAGKEYSVSYTCETGKCECGGDTGARA